MIVLFWILQLLLASVLIVPVAIVVLGGSTGFQEFAIWITATVLWVGTASLLARLLRINGRVGGGVLVLAIGLAPFALLAWGLFTFAQNWHH